MSRYIKKFARVGHSLGPSAERGFALWVGYDIENTTGSTRWPLAVGRSPFILAITPRPTANSQRPTANGQRKGIEMTIDELKAEAAEVARGLAEAGGALPNDLRQRFLAVRAELFQRGVFDPLLARFDTATVPRASTAEIANELKLLAEGL
jgi:hypothetical protein